MPGLDVTAGTGAFVKNISFGGQQRQVLYIYPLSPPSGNAPVLLLLTYQEGTPVAMANLARAGRIAAQYGAWVIVPAPGSSGQWADDPGNSGETTDDVGFLADVIGDAGVNYPVDTTRIYAAGYSNSAFMVERLNCERADLIAGSAMIAATERYTEISVCDPSRAVPAVFFDGTADLIVPYGGLLDTFDSAPQAYANWVGYDGCAASATTTTTLPVVVQDGTSVTLNENQSCAGGSAVALYTIQGGGHTWPGNQDGAYTLYLGPTTQNIDATLALWQFFTAR